MDPRIQRRVRDEIDSLKQLDYVVILNNVTLTVVANAVVVLDLTGFPFKAPVASVEGLEIGPVADWTPAMTLLTAVEWALNQTLPLPELDRKRYPELSIVDGKLHLNTAVLCQRILGDDWAAELAHMIRPYDKAEFYYALAENRPAVIGTEPYYKTVFIYSTLEMAKLAHSELSKTTGTLLPSSSASEQYSDWQQRSDAKHLQRIEAHIYQLGFAFYGACEELSSNEEERRKWHQRAAALRKF